MGNKPTLDSIARGRCWALQKLQSQIDLPFYDSLETRCTLIFPYGRFDSVYALLLDAYWPKGEPTNAILHYQRHGFHLRLVYQVPLKSIPMPVKKGARFERLVDCVAALGYEPKPLHNPVAWKDLRTVQNYVEYIRWIRTNELSVTSLSGTAERAARAAIGITTNVNRQWYSLDADPQTRQKITPQEFYRRYGLPPLKDEGRQ